VAGGEWRRGRTRGRGEGKGREKRMGKGGKKGEVGRNSALVVGGVDASGGYFDFF